ncbi:MAG: ABC transporter permease [Betaproteobacteria bacterium]|nr:ABC transporter permease [Betaproteobacteria bacterium]
MSSATAPESLQEITLSSDPGDLARTARRDICDGLMMWELWARLGWSETKRRYRRTLLGPFWVSASLALFATVLAFVWASLWKQGVREYLPFLLSGLLPWTMIAGSIGESCYAFFNGEALIKSRQFAYTTLINVVLARNVIVFLHNLIAYFAIALAIGAGINAWTLLLLPGLLLVTANLAWICLLITILCLRYRDFQQMVTSLIQIAMFVTPVFWSPAQLKGDLAWIVDWNLLYHLIYVIRAPLLGQAPEALSYLVCTASALLGWFAAVWLYSRKRHRIAYWF